MTPILALALIVTMSAQGQDFSADNWVHQHYHEILNRAMPLTDCDIATAKDRDLCMMVRVLPPGIDSGDKEIQFTVERTVQGAARLRSTTPGGTSIYSQAVRAAAGLATPSVDAVATQVHAQTTEVDKATARQVGRAIAHLLELKRQLVPTADLLVEPTEYTVIILRGTSRTEVNVFGPGPRATLQPDPLLKWVEDVRSTLSRSTTKRGP